MVKNGQIKLIDFGLSQRYLDDNGVHIKQGKANFAGSPYYASINCLKDITSSRRDDLESLGYTIMNLIYESKIPWKNSPSNSSILNSKIFFLNDDEISYWFIGSQKYLKAVTNLRFN